jgi:hypothetical protein
MGGGNEWHKQREGGEEYGDEIGVEAQKNKRK